MICRALPADARAVQNVLTTKMLETEIRQDIPICWAVVTEPVKAIAPSKGRRAVEEAIGGWIRSAFAAIELHALKVREAS